MGCVASKKAIVSVTPAADSSGVLRDRAPEPAAVSASSLRSSAAAAAAAAARLVEKKDDAEEPGRPSSPWRPRPGASGCGTSGGALRGSRWPPGGRPGSAPLPGRPSKAGSLSKPTLLRSLRRLGKAHTAAYLGHVILTLERLCTEEGLDSTILSQRVLYLVFEYMEHDLAGLCSSPDIKFTEAQVKCYMNQLLSGLEHCHSRRIVHRDIKGANLLVNNEGVLKIADFGLANYFDPSKNHPLTSRVVTLWYRPPELLLGSTHYDSAVDLWSVGCVFAELFRGRPILQGRTEVEQLHKIFKLCGSPADDYWKKSRLPHATIFKPHCPYLSTLRDVFKEVPQHAFSLLETLLSVEPYKRGTASCALTSEFFKTKPYACEPISLPQYAPNKEMDAKLREELHRRKASGRGHGPEASKKSSRLNRAAREQNAANRQTENGEESKTKPKVIKDGAMQVHTKVNGDARLFTDTQLVSAAQVKERARHVKNDLREEIPFSGPLIVSSSSGFAWAKKPEGRSFTRSRNRSSSRGEFTDVDWDNKRQAKENIGLEEQHSRDVHVARANLKVREPQEVAKRAVLKKWSQLERPDSFDSRDTYHSQNFSNAIYLGDALSSKNSMKDDHYQGERVEYSGPLLSQTHKVDELLEKHRRHIRKWSENRGSGEE
ncbi:hypothetical protein ZWY2020_052006 [Hordeum vulgare]|nr:hypothetical protein ZWY2020_052006 [Hordeum vulgare]